MRARILAFVGALVLFSLLGSTISLYRITEVNRSLDAINQVSVPLGRLFSQMQSDADVFSRELERSLGVSHWKDPHWKPRPIPEWIEDVLTSEIKRVQELVRSRQSWAPDEARERWSEWADTVGASLARLREDARKLHAALEARDDNEAARVYPRWTAGMEEWRRELAWGSAEYERALRLAFAQAEARVSELRTGLELILGVIVLMSLMVLWLGDRALRPLGELTKLAREITRRGLRREDKEVLPDISLLRDDEVSRLALEFHRMATALLEREKTVDAQKQHLMTSNRLLREMGELNASILNSIESVVIVSDPDGRVTQANPVAARFATGQAAAEPAALARLIGSQLSDWPALRSFVPAANLLGVARRIEPAASAAHDGRVYGGHWLPRTDGAILVLHDLTAELDLQNRLRQAEHLAAVGRMSAQVAHEVRNPLHSIGLEAEMAAELAANLPAGARQGLQSALSSIMGSVDRLEKITDNYLRLSRLSTGERAPCDLGEILESALATYAPACESQRVSVDWRREGRGPIRVLGDRDLLEQALGNLMNNSLQALEVAAIPQPQIRFALGLAESGRAWLRIEDNGPGIAPEIRDKLFTPFVTTRAQGTGLGLSFIKRVVEDHGGEIRWVDTSRGACFELVFAAETDGMVSVNPSMEAAPHA